MLTTNRKRSRLPRQPSYYVYPYKVGSNSARSLADALGGRVIKLEGSRFKPAPWRRVINWGNSMCPYGAVNKSLQVVNKAEAFDLWSRAGVSIPRYTRSRQEALQWLQDKVCKKVVSRATLTGHSGSGIIVHTSDAPPENLPNTPLYVEYIPKDAEFRLHVARKSPNGEYEVFDCQRKIREPGREPTSWEVRSHANGFIFARSNPDSETTYLQTLSDDWKQEAIKAVASAGLDFGAVDLIVNNKRGKCFILEVNCSPGLEGQSIDNYAAMIKRYYES